MYIISSIALIPKALNIKFNDVLNFHKKAIMKKFSKENMIFKMMMRKNNKIIIIT